MQATPFIYIIDISQGILICQYIFWGGAEIGSCNNGLRHVIFMMEAGNMVLLVVDTQKLITNKELYNFELFVSNVKKLINTARDNNIEVIYVREGNL